MRVICILLLATASWCQVAQEANRDYQTPELRAKMVERLESPARLANLRPAELISQLKILRGSTVVDLGTGTGTLLEDLSLAVGSNGRVIAEDARRSRKLHPVRMSERETDHSQKRGLTGEIIL